MKNNKIKLIASILLSSSVVFATACDKFSCTKTEDYEYTKSSAELLHFKSSDSTLDTFLNDYVKRHSGYIDENGKNQKVNSVTAGVDAKQFFWQEIMQAENLI